MGQAAWALEEHIHSCSICRKRVSALETLTRDPAPGAPVSFTQALDAASVRPGAEVALASAEPGRYRVGREIARGGMGRILEAWDVRHERPVAIKVLLEARAGSKWRFVREAQLTARLQHPSIIPVYEAGRWENGEPFFAMKLVEGRSLAAVLSEVQSFEQRLGLLPHLLTATEAIAYAHAHGIVHRDLKPGNVLVGAYGETVVIDWGLAKRLDDRAQEDVAALEEAPLGATRAGLALGTPGYMPPEQARGEPLDARADVYALGAMLYQVLSGRVPHHGGTSEQILQRLLAGAPEQIARLETRVPPDLAAIVEKAMSRELAARYPSAREMAEDLRRFSNGQLVSAHAYTTGQHVRRWVAKRKGLVALAAASLAAMGALAGVSVRRVTRERDAARSARTEAETQRQTAVTRRDAAENLIAALVGDFREKLIPIGKLDVMAALGERVGEYYRTIPPDEGADAATLARRAKAVGTLAGVYDVKSDTEAAIRGYLEAISLCDRAIAKQPSELEALSLRAWYLDRVALQEQRRGHVDAALDLFDRSLTAFASYIPRLSNPTQIAEDNEKRGFATSMLSDVLRAGPKTWPRIGGRDQ